MNRLLTDFGNDGLHPGSVTQGRLRAFSGLYRFNGTTWGITVWAMDWEDAAEYCLAHGLKLDGRIEEIIPS